jgi:hypothetical protein
MFGMGSSNVSRCGALGDWLPSMQWKRLGKRTRERCVKRNASESASLRPNKESCLRAQGMDRRCVWTLKW